MSSAIGWTALAVTTAAVAGAGAAVYSANTAADAAQQAAQTQADAQGKATAAQTASQDQAITEQRRQFDNVQSLLKPYISAGSTNLTQQYINAGPGALQGMQSLAGLRGAGEQQASIDQIKQSAQYQELARQGEQGILQNASATGGLRGGNVQAALAQFRPSLLNQLIESQYGKLAGLTSLGSTSAENLLRLGQASAAGTAAAGQQSAANIGNLYSAQGAAQAAGYTGIGQAQAGGIIGAANAQAQGAAGISNAFGGGIQNYMLMNALNKGGLGGTTGGIGSSSIQQSSPGYMTPSANYGESWTPAQSAALYGQ